VNVQLIDAIGKPENGDVVRAVVRDVVEEARAKDTEQKSRSFVRKKLQRANAEMQSALGAVGAGATKVGVEEQAVAIEKALARIREWLREGA
jgi:hypothetical protein